MPQEPMQIKDRRNHPFCIVETPVLMDEALSTHDKMVYVVLCSFASSRSRECFPSVATIAKRASCGERQVRKSLAVLEERGYIEREFSLGHATTYNILDLPEAVASGAAPCAGGNDVQETPAPRAGEGGTTCPHNKKSLTRTKEQEKDYSPSGRGNEPPAMEPKAEIPDGNLPVSEAPEAMRSTAEYLLLKTGRTGLKESEISDLRKLNATHYPAVVQGIIDQSVERFKRTGRDLRQLDFAYVADTLKYRKPTRPPGGQKVQRGGITPVREDYSDLNV